MVKPNMHWWELDITYVCGMGCVNCNRMTGIAPGRPEENLTIEQVDKLIEDSVRLQYPWKAWFLVGGEPTTHPDLDVIVGRIGEYHNQNNRNLKLTLATHGHGEQTRHCLAKLAVAFPFLQFLNSHKTGAIHPDFVCPCVAPCDIDSEWCAQHRFEGCGVSGHCGLSMNHTGFFPCAVAGAIDRIFGLSQAIKNLDDVSEAAMADKYQVFCRYCGYYRPIRENSHNLLSPTWRTALKRYLKHFGRR